MGLRLRVILILTIPLLLAVAIHGYLRVRREEAQLLREDRQSMDLTAVAIQLAVQHAPRDRENSEIRRLLVEMVDQQDAIDRIRLFDSSLQPTLVSNPLSIGETVPTDALTRVVRTGASELFYERGHPSLLYYLAPLRDRTGKIEGAMEIVRLGSSVDRRVAAATYDSATRLGILLVVVVVVTAVAMQGQVLRPLGRL